MKNLTSRNWYRAWLCAVTLAAVGIFNAPTSTMAQSKESRFDVGEEEHEHRFLLEIRTENEYGTCAFSFQTESQDVDVHRNNVDLVFGNCGLLHFNPIVGMKSRVADLGEEDLDVEVDLEEEDREWSTSAFAPQEGHVYLQVVRHKGGSMKVKYRIDEASNDKLTISFEVLEKWAGAAPMSSAKAGAMGMCGGRHPAK